MTKRFALIWLWWVLSVFFTIILIPTHSIHTWYVDISIFIFVAITIYAIYTLTKFEK